MENNLICFLLMLLVLIAMTIFVIKITKDYVFMKKPIFYENWKIGSVISYICVLGLWICSIGILYLTYIKLLK